MLLFTLIILALSGVVLAARYRLAVREQIVININGQQTLKCLSGDTLLNTLSEAGIFLPAACGGRATCGQCRVVVNEGGGALLPTETAHINRRDAIAGFRLACMLNVRNDIDLELPENILTAQHWRGKVRTNRNLATFLTELTLDLPEDAALHFQAGDYVLVRAPAGPINFSDFPIDPEFSGEWDRLDLKRFNVDIEEPTRRAYSLANSPEDDNQVTLVVRIALPPVNAPADTPPGKVSSYIFSLQPGDVVELSGPFGDFPVRDSTREMILIGGGAGIAPLHSMIRDQLINHNSKRKISFWYGSRNRRELVYSEEFERLMNRHENFSYQVALSAPEPDDIWEGYTGLIHTVLYDNYLQGHPHPEAADYYLCGPPLMSSAVLTMLEDLGVARDQVFLDDFGSQLKRR